MTPGHCAFPFPLAANPKASQSTWYSLVQSFCSACKHHQWVAGTLRGRSLGLQGGHRGPRAMESLQPVQGRAHPLRYFSLCPSTKKTVKCYSNLTYSVNKHQHQTRSIMLLGTGATNQDSPLLSGKRNIAVISIHYDRSPKVMCHRI